MRDFANEPLVLGIGNSLLSDDGVGIHVVNALEAMRSDGAELRPFATRDGGTIGLALLSEIAGRDDLIVVDAMELHAAPGTVRVFRDADMNRQLSGVKKSAHEVALADLIQASELAGFAPKRRALVAVQPEITTWGLTPTPAVQEAVDTARDEILSILAEWSNGN
ncbi:MAG: HyaD/HybD family hydrogenase maturation endopeptidase [Phyllobacteriaceae bacterium]|nr:HyaD/HybD family hydrogenase maturation endopeptidase [Phyllobacteriaceae bacterium]